jgi:hypothetical protein
VDSVYFLAGEHRMHELVSRPPSAAMPRRVIGRFGVALGLSSTRVLFAAHGCHFKRERHTHASISIQTFFSLPDLKSALLAFAEAIHLALGFGRPASCRLTAARRACPQETQAYQPDLRPSLAFSRASPAHPFSMAMMSCCLPN